jgi:hypothetical protein
MSAATCGWYAPGIPTPPPEESGCGSGQYPTCSTGSCSAGKTCRKVDQDDTCKCVRNSSGTTVTLEGDISFDFNKNSVFDEACSSIIQTSESASCGAYPLGPSFVIGYDKSTGESAQWVYHSGCGTVAVGDPCGAHPKYSINIPAQGTYTFTLWMNGFKLVNAYVNGAFIAPANNYQVTANLASNTNTVIFLVQASTSPPTCTISGPTSVCLGYNTLGQYTANCSDADGNLAGLEMFASPQSSFSMVKIGDYDFIPAVGSAARTSNISYAWPTLGSYYVTDNGYDSTPQTFVNGGWCSGNPWCSEWSPTPPGGGEFACRPLLYGGSTYYFYDCGPSDVLNVTVNPIGVPLSPIVASSCPSSDPTLTFSWSAPTCGNRYKVYRCTGVGCTPSTQIGGLLSSLSYTDNTVSPETDYGYRVQACDPNGLNCGGYSAISYGRVELSEPTGFSATPVCSASSYIGLSWSDGTCKPSGSTYTIQRCTGTNCTTYLSDLTTGLNATSYNDTTAVPATVYSYRIRTDNVTAHSNWVETAASKNVSINTTTPGTPVPSASCPANDPTIDLSWSLGGCYNTQNLQRCTGTGCITWFTIANPASSSYSDTTINPNTIYRYRVGACNGLTCLYSGATADVSVPVYDPTSATTAQSCPLNDPTVTVNWTDGACSTTNQVRRCSGSCSTWNIIDADATTPLADNTISTNTNYCYQVRSYWNDSSLYSSNWVNPSPACQTVNISPPSSPVLTGSCLSNNPTVDMSWSGVSCVQNYQIQRCTGASCSSFANLATTASNSYSDTSIDPNTTYCYQVGGCNGGVCGNWLNLGCTGVQIPAVTGLNATASCPLGTTPYLDLAWNDVSCQTSYYLERCTGSGCTPSSYTTTAGDTNTYSDTVTDDITYGYRLRASLVGSSGTRYYGGYSNTVYDSGRCMSCNVAIIPPDPDSGGTIVAGDNVALSSVVTNIDDGSVDNVTFDPSNTSVMNCPSPDYSSPYTSICSTSGGATNETVSSNVYMRDVSGTLIAIPVCSATTAPFDICTPSCSINFVPASPGISYGRTVDVIVSANRSCGSSPTLSFSSLALQLQNGLDGVSNTSTTDPLTYGASSSNPYSVTVGITGNSTGTDILAVSATLNDASSTTCTATTNMTVYEPEWWQAFNSDVTAFGSLESDLTTGARLIDGTEPGVAMYGATPASINVGSGAVSSRNWRVNTSNSLGSFNYSQLSGMLPAGFWTTAISGSNLDESYFTSGTNGQTYQGYHWYYYDGAFGDLVLEDTGDGVINLANNKVVIFVGGGVNFNIRSDVIFGNTGFLLVVSSGNIKVYNPTVGSPIQQTLQGIYIATGNFNSETIYPLVDLPLVVKGYVIANSFSLNRNIQSLNSAQASEYFENYPGLLFLIPNTLSISDTQWREVAP